MEKQMPTPQPGKQASVSRAILIWGMNGFIFGLVELSVSLAHYPRALPRLVQLSWGLLVYPLLGMLAGSLLSLLTLAFRRSCLHWEAFHASLSLTLYSALFLVNWMREMFFIKNKPLDPHLPFAQAGVLALAGTGSYILYRLLSRRRDGRDFLRAAIAYAFALYTLTTVGLHMNGLFIPEQLSQTSIIYSWLLAIGVVLMAWIIYRLLGGLARWDWRLKLGVFLAIAGIWFVLHMLTPRQFSKTRPPGTTAVDRPNILLLTIDALRPDHLSCYGYRGIQTPAIDSLAREGVRFERAVVQAPWTIPSFSSIFSSLYPSVHFAGKINFNDKRTTAPLRPGIPWLPSILQRAGYYTQAIINNGLLSDEYNFVRGFDDYYNLFDQYYELELVGKERSFLWRFLQFWKPSAPSGNHSFLLTQKSLKWLSRPPQPFFLWIHYFDPHLPYERRKSYNLNPAYQGKLRSEEIVRHLEPKDIKVGIYKLTQADKEYLKSVYDEEILLVDEEIGKLLEKLGQTGLLDNTFIILTSDHGEEFWEHQHYEHGHSLYRELTHTPLILRYPKALPQNMVIPYQVRAIDIAPTILELVGQEGVRLQGRSLFPLIRGEETGHRPAFSEFLLFSEEAKALDTGEYKFIFAPSSRRAELYDLRQDPLEQHNIIARDPQLGQQFLKRLIKWGKECRKWAKSYTPSSGEQAAAPDAASRQRLKALGYIE
jgi:arylsulfatase A-like enzyme